MTPAFLASVGLEIHVQLRTHTKIWCGCPNRTGQPPNTDVCPVCLGYPGALPVLNRRAVDLTVKAGLMLGCEINRWSKWDRKNYYYPDMAKNYQISQYDLPLCLGGGLEIETEGGLKPIRLVRIHLEEDVAKNTHHGTRSSIDFNRAGTPLMEIVTEPDLSSAEETFAFLQGLKEILAYGEISDCNLEEGNIRCDVNCSVRPADRQDLGVKTEIKNMNTFRGVHRALSYEIQRQMAECARGGRIVQETRRWDEEAGITVAMRSKEYAHDYRYFPEPDLLPVRLRETDIESMRDSVPELPRARRRRFVEEFGLPAYDAGVLVADKALADYFETAARLSGNAKAVSNWLMTEMLRALSERNQGIAETLVRPDDLVRLIELVDRQVINSTAAKQVFQVLFDEGGSPDDVVQAKGLAQVSDAGAIAALVDQVIGEHPKSVESFRAGKEAALQHLVGQVMRLSKGKANPQMVNRLLRQKLGP